MLEVGYFCWFHKTETKFPKRRCRALKRTSCFLISSVKLCRPLLVVMLPLITGVVHLRALRINWIKRDDHHLSNIKTELCSYELQGNKAHGRCISPRQIKRRTLQQFQKEKASDISDIIGLLFIRQLTICTNVYIAAYQIYFVSQALDIIFEMQICSHRLNI